MIYTALCRPHIDKVLAAKVSLWLRSQVKRDVFGQTDVEFYVWGDDAYETDDAHS